MSACFYILAYNHAMMNSVYRKIPGGGYIDPVVDTLEKAMTLVEENVQGETSKSIGLIGNAASIYPEAVVRGVIPDVVADQTPSHDVQMYVLRD
jgi:urocanate hydratase